MNLDYCILDVEEWKRVPAGSMLGFRSVLPAGYGRRRDPGMGIR